MQDVEPTPSVKKPAGHALHAERDVADRAVLAVFLGHGVGVPEPTGQKYPAGQPAPAQALAPDAGEKVPAGQPAQEEAPLLEKVPAGQNRQKDTLAAAG
jgi:hypothetical protein